MKAAVLLTAWLLACAAPAARAATIHTVSGERLEGKLSAITADGHLELVRAGRTSRIPLAQVYRIDVQDRAPSRDPASSVEVRTVGGSKLFGKLVASEKAVGLLCAAVGQAAHFDAPGLRGLFITAAGSPKFGLEKFEGELARAGKDADRLFVRGPKEVVSFDVIVASVGPQKTALKLDGADRTIDTGKVAALVFANNPNGKEAGAVVRLTDACVLRGQIVSLRDGRLEMDLSGAKASVPMTNVVSIELANPNVAYLSDLKPVEAREVAFFDHVWPHRTDRSVGGKPITLDGRKYSRGIGCHTRTLLTYDLGGEYKRFAAVIGIDDEARPRGSVEFVVKADGRQILSRKLTGRDKAAPILLDITGARKLTLVADFADDASIGDHADWADARVLK